MSGTKAHVFRVDIKKTSTSNCEVDVFFIANV